MKPPKTHCNGTWTTARFFGFIRSALRRTWTRWPEQYRARHMARRPYKGKNKLQKWEFLCAECNEWFMAKNTQIHHRIECGTLKNFNDIAGFTERLLCPAENLMVLCKKCHKQKHHPKKQNNNCYHK